MATRIAVLVNPTNRNSDRLSSDLLAAGRTLEVKVEVVRAATAAEIESIFASLSQSPMSGLVINPDPFFVNQRELLVALAIRYAVPAISPYRESPAAGGLISYGNNLLDPYRLVGIYAGRILKGEKPADLPVQQVVKVGLVLNLKTAKALGLTVPQSILLRADEVIE